MPKRQDGAIIVVVLVLLAVVTMFGISNMQSSSMEMRMIAVSGERSRAMAMAESVLEYAEKELLDMRKNDADLQTDTCTSNCFTNTCTNGLCFDGVFDSSSGGTRGACEVASNALTTARPVYWRDSAIWTNANQHRTYTVGGVTGKYIIEFLCYIDNGADDAVAGPKFPLTDLRGVPNYRITVYIENGRAPVMIQSNLVTPEF